jgi:hypothetical protein
MAAIIVKTLDDATFEVTVEGYDTTRHRVTVSPEYCRRLTGGRVDAAALVEVSFEFLLEREPNTSILRSFELPVIGRYFPEYERVIGERLG